MSDPSLGASTMDDAALSWVHPSVADALRQIDVAGKIIECDPALADTAMFCEHYGYPLSASANTIIVKAKTGEEKFAACLLLATMRLDVNKTVRKRLQTRRISFATPEETKHLTGMELGGVTPLALPAELPLWIDADVMRCDEVILGGGNRASKVIIAPAALTQLPNAEVIEQLAAGRPDPPA